MQIPYRLSNTFPGECRSLTNFAAFLYYILNKRDICLCPSCRYAGELTPGNKLYVTDGISDVSEEEVVAIDRTLSSG